MEIQLGAAADEYKRGRKTQNAPPLHARSGRFGDAPWAGGVAAFGGGDDDRTLIERLATA